MPNLSPGARHLRIRMARASAIAAFAAFIMVMVADLPWWARAMVVFIPTVVALISYLEARNSVCVLRAAGGTFENDDHSKVPMERGALPAIRHVAASLTVKSLLLAVPVALAAALTALIH